MLAEYARRRDFVIGRLRAIPGVTCAEPRGAFYAYPNIGVALAQRHGTTVQFAEKLLDKGGAWPWCPARRSARTSTCVSRYATSMHELERGLDRLHRFIVEQ